MGGAEVPAGVLASSTCEHLILGSARINNRTCGKPAKFVLASTGPLGQRVCGTHARFWRDRGASVVAIEASGSPGHR